LAFAVEGRRTLLTVNRRHFIRLHSQLPQHYGIIVCTVDLDFTGQAARIHAAIEACPNPAGQLIRINRPAG
jgi:hypothetical protein